MPTNREAYFEVIKLGIPKGVANFALQEVNGFSYLELTKRFDEEINNYSLFKESVDRYLNGEMIEYFFNKAYFLGNSLYVDQNVLIPRQETEQLVLESQKLIKELFGENLNIADVCCGSGAIGLSLNKLLSNNSYFLSDISKEAVRVSNKNAILLEVVKNTTVLEGDMLKPFVEAGIKLDVIICNPPYIKDIKTIDKRTFEQEPHLALLADPDTKFYEELLKDCHKVLKSKYLIAFEIGEDMKESMDNLVKKYCPYDEYFFQDDIYGKTRFLFIKHQ